MTAISEQVVWRGADELRAHLRLISELKPFPGNARRGDVPALMKSLDRFGQVRAVLVWQGEQDTTIVAGHHIVEAAKQLGWTHIAATQAEFESHYEAAAYNIADNALARKGKIDMKGQVTIAEDILANSPKGLDGTGFTVDDVQTHRALQVHEAEMVHEQDLKEHPRNYRQHPRDQVEHLTKSLMEHGFYRNVVVANDGTVLAGHGIVIAAREAGIKKVPVIRMDFGPDDPRALKIVAGDNELGKLSEVDDRQLTEILKEVKETGNVSALLGTGYDAQQLALLVYITRPESEIQHLNAAAEWIGLPEFEAGEEPIQLIMTFDTEEVRDEFCERYGIKPMGRNRLTWSTRWPQRDREDPASVKFVVTGEEVPSEEVASW